MAAWVGASVSPLVGLTGASSFSPSPPLVVGTPASFALLPGAGAAPGWPSASAAPSTPLDRAPSIDPRTEDGSETESSPAPAFAAALLSKMRISEGDSSAGFGTPRLFSAPSSPGSPARAGGGGRRSSAGRCADKASAFAASSANERPAFGPSSRDASWPTAGRI
eukprot:1768227-Pyramimonas_sp.AAC.1